MRESCINFADLCTRNRVYFPRSFAKYMSLHVKRKIHYNVIHYDNKEIKEINKYFNKTIKKGNRSIFQS